MARTRKNCKNDYCKKAIRVVKLIKRERNSFMQTRFFTVTKIEGEYAYLTERETGEELFVALALLPPSVDVGTALRYENLEFSVEM